MNDFPQHKKFNEGMTLNESLGIRNFIPLPKTYKKLDAFAWKDESLMSSIISLIIHKCRYARIQENEKDFNKIANLIAPGHDLSFASYREMKAFSCTEETERKFYQKYRKEYDQLFDCLADCSYQKGSSITKYVSNNNCEGSCFSAFNDRTLQSFERTSKYLNERDIQDITSLIID